MTKGLIDLISLANRAGLPLIDVIAEIKSNFENSEVRTRIIGNLERIQKAVLDIPRDLDKTEVTDLEYEWPHSLVKNR